MESWFEGRLKPAYGWYLSVVELRISSTRSSRSGLLCWSRTQRSRPFSFPIYVLTILLIILTSRLFPIKVSKQVSLCCPLMPGEDIYTREIRRKSPVDGIKEGVWIRNTVFAHNQEGTALYRWDWTYTYRWKVGKTVLQWPAQRIKPVEVRIRRW
jgi:hypothetical protein